MYINIQAELMMPVFPYYDEDQFDVCSVHTSDSSYTVVRHRTPLVGRGHHAGFDVNFVSHRDLLAVSGLVSHESQNFHMNVSYPVRSAFPLPVGLNVKVMQAISVKLKI